MAIIALTELQAVNQILRGSGYATVNSVPSSGTSEAKEANDLLDEMTTKILTLGWPENTEESVPHTPDGGGGSVSAASTTVAIDNDGTWTAASRTLVKIAAFTSYTLPGSSVVDEIYIYSQANSDILIKEGYYGITSKTNADTIILDHQAAIADQALFSARAAGDLEISVATDVLAIRPAGPNRRDPLVLNNQQVVYNTDTQTSKFDNDDTVYLDLIRDFTFENLSNRLKNYIVAWTRLEFQRWKKGLIDRDSFISQELSFADAMIQRNPPETAGEVQPPNFASALSRPKEQDPRRRG